jgi:DNA-binding NtrC family response regulator
MILDLTIAGGMGGKEAIVEIRRIAPDLTVLVASGYADDPVMASPALFGFTDSICKPFGISELSGLLQKYCREKR